MVEAALEKEQEAFWISSTFAGKEIRVTTWGGGTVSSSAAVICHRDRALQTQGRMTAFGSST